MTYPDAPTAVRPVLQWDWRAIWEAERKARRKGARLPRCEVCGQAMWCGQVGAHRTCLPETEV